LGLGFATVSRPPEELRVSAEEAVERLVGTHLGRRADLSRKLFKLLVAEQRGLRPPAMSPVLSL